MQTHQQNGEYIRHQKSTELRAAMAVMRFQRGSKKIQQHFQY